MKAPKETLKMMDGVRVKAQARLNLWE